MRLALDEVVSDVSRTPPTLRCVAMSVTQPSGDDGPNPRDDPEAVIHEELGDHREAIEALAGLDMGVLSDDARQILEILDQEEPS